MILKDEQTGERYEAITEAKDMNAKWTQLRPLDTKEEWPSYEYDYYFISTTGNVHCAAWGDTPDDRKLYECGNCYRTKEEAEQARDRVKSLQEARVVFINEDEATAIGNVGLTVPKKYLKAWEELQDE